MWVLIVHRSLVPQSWIDNFLADTAIPLPADVTTRFFSVVRIKAHEEVAVFDGQGREIIGLLALTPGKKEAVFSQSRTRIESPLSPSIILLQAAINESKLQETIKRGAEYGVDRFIVFEAERSEPFCYKKLQSKHERLVRIAEDACRQSGRLFIPQIDFATSIQGAFRLLKTGQIFSVFGDAAGQGKLSQILRDTAPHGEDIHVVVGPEGGLSPTECDVLVKMGSYGIQWAPFILRTELAGLAAIAIIQAFLGRA